MDGPSSESARSGFTTSTSSRTDRWPATGWPWWHRCGPLAAETMLRIAQELRQFETIFLFDVADDGAEARIFTPEEELSFAGHPVLGAAPSCTPSRNRMWIARVDHPGRRPAAARDDGYPG